MEDTVNSCFSLFGMSTSDSLNMVIAVFAVLGFIASLVISIFTLNQNNKVYTKQNDIALYDKRTELIDYFTSFLSRDGWENNIPDDFVEYNCNLQKLKILFKYHGAYDTLHALLTHFLEKETFPFPDYTSEYKAQLKDNKFKPDDNKQAFVYKWQITL